jgi:hypothetical protein
MRLPGFSGEMSLSATSRHYGRAVATGFAQGSQGVRAQLKGGVFRRPFGGGLSTLGDYWTCKSGCETARSACLATCEGTWESPKPSRNCMLCDDDYRACMWGCSRDIA